MFSGLRLCVHPCVCFELVTCWCALLLIVVTACSLLRQRTGRRPSGPGSGCFNGCCQCSGILCGFIDLPLAALLPSLLPTPVAPAENT